MYLRTPKRYSRGQRRSIISLRWLWLWILTPVVVASGLYLYDNRTDYIPQVEGAMSGLLNQAQSGVATAMAPTPLPTENPSSRLASADAAWMRGAIEESVNIYEGLVEAVPPIQLAIRLLIPTGSRLLELKEVRDMVGPFDPAALAYPWKHPDPRVDALCVEVQEIVAASEKFKRPRPKTFERIWQAAALACEQAVRSDAERTGQRPALTAETETRFAAMPVLASRAAIPYLNEPWYC